MIAMKNLLLRTAVARLVVNTDLWETHELWRAAWSADPRSDDWHLPLRVHERDRRLMAVHRNRWDTSSLTTEDILGNDWEVRRADA
jgi:hypothetical protein